MPEARLLWLPLLVAGGLLYLWLAAALVRRRAGPGSRTMGLALCAVAAWLVAAVAEVLAPSLPAYFAAVDVKYTAVALTPPGFLLFILHYTERFAVRRRHAALLLVVPACTIAMVWTNPWHELMWAHPPLGPDGERVMRLAWGPWWYWVHLPFSYATAGAALLLAVGELFSQSKLYRAQTAMLIVAVLIPFVVNVLFTAGLGSARFGPTPIAFALSGMLLAWGFVRLRLFQLSPIAYRSIFDQMRDGVVVVDRYRRVADINRVALTLAGRSEAEVVGYRVEDALPWREALVGALEVRRRAARMQRGRWANPRALGLLDPRPREPLRRRDRPAARRDRAPARGGRAARERGVGPAPARTPSTPTPRRSSSCSARRRAPARPATSSARSSGAARRPGSASSLHPSAATCW